MDSTLVPSNLNAFWAMLWTWGVAFLPRLVAAVFILFVGSIVARWVGRIASTTLAQASHIDETTRPVLASVLRYGILVLAIVAALSQIGVQMASLLAVLGAAGLAVGLALQGTLANIASGLMLLWLRPFRVGDYIDVKAGNAIAGTVREIGLFACLLETYDGIFVFAPNSTIWNFAVIDYSRRAGRLIVLSVGLPADGDFNRGRDALLQMARDDKRILHDPEPEVFLDSFSQSGQSLTCRFWVASHAVGDLQRSLLGEAKHRLEKLGEGMKPLQITRVLPPDSDPSRLMEA